MLLSTRRRALGLFFGAAAAARLSLVPPAQAQGKKDCFDSKSFGAWKAQASDTQAGARINEVKFNEPCDLRVEVQVAASLEGKIVVYGDPDQVPLPKKFLIEPGNRLIVRNEGGDVAVDEPLCGNCTDIFDDKVSIVLPLACAPLFREEKSIEMEVKLVDKDSCRFKLNCETLRAGLDWASERQKALAALEAEGKCNPPEGCFITTACCETIGLDDDCFELRALRRYRDHVLVRRTGGAADVRMYYEIAPVILARLPAQERKLRLSAVYARHILPAALAARLGLNSLAYRLYWSMLRALAPDLVSKV